LPQSESREPKIATKASLPKKKLHFTTPFKKEFVEKPHEIVSLEVTKMKKIPEAVPRVGTCSKGGSRSDQEAELRSFMMIKEREFPHLFKNSIVKHQKMSKYLDEQDFNSDCETIERNKSDLLEHLTTAIARFAKSDPVKFVENLKSPNTDIDAAVLQ